MYCELFASISWVYTTTNPSFSVHCQRGVSRSATFVIAHMMRSKSWELSQALKHVKERRKIVKPNTGFIVQLKDLENAFVLGKFSVEPVFSRKPVSLLKEHHETKSASGKALHSPNGSSPMRRQSGKATKTQQPAGEMIELVPAVFMQPTARFSVIVVVM